MRLAFDTPVTLIKRYLVADATVGLVAQTRTACLVKIQIPIRFKYAKNYNDFF
jgi:hypothetical protein